MVERKGYLKKFKKSLSKNRVNNIEDIISDINELIDSKIAEGKSETEVIASLGNPEQLAKQYYESETSNEKPKRSKALLVFIIIFALLLFHNAASLVSSLIALNNTNNIRSKDIIRNVYLESSKTEFNDNYIMISLKNVGNKDFEDIIVHLSYIGNDNRVIGVAYSEQKVVTIEANSTKSITFVNPGWDYSQYSEIYAYIYKGDSTWEQFQNGRTFVDESESTKNMFVALAIINSSFLVVCIVVDIVLIAKYKKGKNVRN